MITRHQIAAARALLEWTQDDLAGASGVSKDMISKIEGGKSAGSLKSIQNIQGALEKSGLEFSENEGVSRRSGNVSIFKGRTGFLDFLIDVYETVKNGGEILVSNVNEADFLKWEGDEAQAHMDRMASIQNLRFRILIEEGDDNVVASNYAKYKQVPIEQFNDIPLYMYGDKTGIIVFEDDNVEVFVVSHPTISAYFRSRFLETWKTAKDI